MKIGRFFKDVFMVSIGNILYLLANILLGFVLPALMNINDYGYYKIYCLYLGYSGLLHFGFIDGVLLMFAGKKYEELDFEAFRLYTRLFVSIEVLAGAVVCLISFLCFDGIYRIIGLFVSLNMICNNVTMYYQYISQAVCRFKEFASRKIFIALFLCIIMLALFLYARYFGMSPGFILCISLMTVVNLIMLAKYILTYRNITFGNRKSLGNERNNVLQIFKNGILMTIGYEISRLVLLLDQQFVSSLFSVELFAQYAFAYSIVSVITSLLSSLCVVLLPRLKQMKETEIFDKFPTMLSFVMILIAFCLVGYTTIEWAVSAVLPKYTEALMYLKIVFPSILFTGSVTIVVSTFYNAIGKIKFFCIISVIALAISFLLNFCAYAFFGSAEAISIVSLFAVAIWYVLTVGYFSRKYSVPFFRGLAYMVLTACSFFVSVLFLKGILSVVFYLCAFTLVTFAFYGSELGAYKGVLLKNKTEDLE